MTIHRAVTMQPSPTPSLPGTPPRAQEFPLHHKSPPYADDLSMHGFMVSRRCALRLIRHVEAGLTRTPALAFDGPLSQGAAQRAVMKPEDQPTRVRRAGEAFRWPNGA